MTMSYIVNLHPVDTSFGSFTLELPGNADLTLVHDRGEYLIAVTSLAGSVPKKAVRFHVVSADKSFKVGNSNTPRLIGMILIPPKFSSGSSDRRCLVREVSDFE